MALARTHRDAALAAAPRWLRTGLGAKILFAIGAQLDALTDGLVAAVKLRFPGLYSYDSLVLIGRERRLLRGVTETDAVYAERLPGWLDAHARRGNAYELLRQLFAVDAPTYRVWLVYYSGRTFAMDTTGAVTMSDIAWTPDADAERWARQWMIYEWPTAVGTDGTWDSGGVWSDGGVWDSTLTEAQVLALRRVPRAWSAAHMQSRIVLQVPGSELWDFPSGTWSEPGVWPTAVPITVAVG